MFLSSSRSRIQGIVRHSRSLTSKPRNFDLGRQLLQGKVQPKDLSIRELKELLQDWNVSIKDCHDKESLQKRLAGSLLNQYKMERRMQEEILSADTTDDPTVLDQFDQDVTDDPLTLHTAHLIIHTPWTIYGINKEIFGSSKDLLLMIPSWEDDRVESIFQKQHLSNKNPEIAAQQREVLIERVAALDLDSQETDPRENAPIGTAAAMLYRHGKDKDKDIYLLEGSILANVPLLQQTYTRPVMSWNKVPKNWPPGGEDMAESGRNPESVLKAIDFFREHVGECEPLEPLDPQE